MISISSVLPLTFGNNRLDQVSTSETFVFRRRIRVQMQSLNPKSRLYDLALLLVAIAVSTSAFAYFGGAKIVTQAMQFATFSRQGNVQPNQRDSETLLQEIRLDTTTDERNKLATNSSQFSTTPSHDEIILSEAPKWVEKSESSSRTLTKSAEPISSNSESEKTASTFADEHSNQMLFPDFDENSNDEKSSEAAEESLFEFTENKTANKDGILSENTDLANSKPKTQVLTSPIEQPETLHVIQAHNNTVDVLPPQPIDDATSKSSIDPNLALNPNADSERRNTQFVVPNSSRNGLAGDPTQTIPRQLVHAPKQHVGLQMNRPTIDRQSPPPAAPAEPNSMMPRHDKLRHSTLFAPKQNTSSRIIGDRSFFNRSQSGFAWPGIRK